MLASIWWKSIFMAGFCRFCMNSDCDGTEGNNGKGWAVAVGWITFQRHLSLTYQNKLLLFCLFCFLQIMNFCFELRNFWFVLAVFRFAKKKLSFSHLKLFFFIILARTWQSKHFLGLSPRWELVPLVCESETVGESCSAKQLSFSSSVTCSDSGDF